MDEETDTFDEEMDGSGEETQSIALRYYFSDAGESERSEEDHGSSQFRCVFLDTAFKHKRFSLQSLMPELKYQTFIPELHEQILDRYQQRKDQSTIKKKQSKGNW